MGWRVVGFFLLGVLLFCALLVITWAVSLLLP